MIRRLAGRLRREVAARLVPLRHAFRSLAVQAAHAGSTLAVIARALRASARVGHSPRRLRIGVDIRPFYEPLTGVGWYLFFLLEELSRHPDVELVLFGEPLLTDDGPRLFVSLPGNPRVIGIDLRGRQITRYSLPLARGAYLLMSVMERCDLIFGANYFLPRALSATARRRVITIHDLTYRRFPELLQAETLENLEREMLREVTRADAIICVSESTRQDVLRAYQVDPHKVFAVHSGVRVEDRGSRVPSRGSETRDPGLVIRDLAERYILFVSTIEPRKNLETLIRAFELLRDEGRYQGDLVVVGKVGWKAEPAIKAMNSSRWRKSIHHLDYLDRETLSAVYRGADAFVLPSHYEGFGLPLLEAMAHDVPVVAARSSSLPEVGGDAALYFDPESAEQLAEAIVTASGPPAREQLIRKGRERVAAFPWKKTAAETVEIFRRVANR